MGINEALNALSAAQILKQAVQPMEQIESIRIFHVSGMPGAAHSGGVGGAGEVASGAGRSGATFPEQAMNSALQYQLVKPIVDAVMKDAGLSNDGITGVAGALSGMLRQADPAGGGTAAHGRP